MLAKSLFQFLQRGALPLAKHHQVDIAEGENQEKPMLKKSGCEVKHHWLN